MDRQHCLKRRMFNAAVETYHPRLRPALGGNAGWTADPVPVTHHDPAVPPALRLPSGPDIDLALVGPVAEGILIAFRGTLPPLDLINNHLVFRPESPDVVLSDWLNNGEILLLRNFVLGAVRVPGAIHKGFAHSTAHLWGDAGQGVVAEVTRLLGQGAQRRLYFAGHSKGGALANLAAYCATQTWDATVKVVTVGAPRPGEQAFADAYRSAGIECLRYEVADDKVPGVLKKGPFGALGGRLSITCRSAAPSRSRGLRVRFRTCWAGLGWCEP